MRKIKSSLTMFENFSSVLGKRQSGGSVDKRQAIALNLKAIRLRADGTRIGFETVKDTGVERERLYCIGCGMMTADEDEICRLCGISFISEKVNLSDNKYNILCKDCFLPFHIKVRLKTEQNLNKWILKSRENERYNIRFDAKKAIGKNLEEITDLREFDRSSEICCCYDEKRQSRAKELRRDRDARKAYLEDVKLARKSKVLTAYRVELEAIYERFNSLNTIDKSELSRKAKKELFAQKFALAVRRDELKKHLALI